MTDPTPLLSPLPEPAFRMWQAPSAGDLDSTTVGWRDASLVVRIVRGREMRTAAQLDDEFAAALQFPTYYGANWAAFNDCLTDLDWLPPEAGYVVVVTEPLLVLDDSPADLEVFVRTLASVIEHWATPIQSGEWWDRPAVAFNVVLAMDTTSASAVRNRWTTAGAALCDLY